MLPCINKDHASSNLVTYVFQHVCKIADDTTQVTLFYYYLGCHSCKREPWLRISSSVIVSFLPLTPFRPAPILTSFAGKLLFKK